MAGPLVTGDLVFLFTLRRGEGSVPDHGLITGTAGLLRSDPELCFAEVQMRSMRRQGDVPMPLIVRAAARTCSSASRVAPLPAGRQVASGDLIFLESTQQTHACVDPLVLVPRPAALNLQDVSLPGERMWKNRALFVSSKGLCEASGLLADELRLGLPSALMTRFGYLGLSDDARTLVSGLTTPSTLFLLARYVSAFTIDGVGCRRLAPAEVGFLPLVCDAQNVCTIGDDGPRLYWTEAQCDEAAHERPDEKT